MTGALRGACGYVDLRSHFRYAKYLTATDLEFNSREAQSTETGRATPTSNSRSPVGISTDSRTGAPQRRWKGRYGDVAVTVANSYSRDSGGNNPSVTASYSSSFVVARRGVFLGASASQSDPRTGFAVRVGKRDDASGMAAEVRSDSSARIKVGFGSAHCCWSPRARRARSRGSASARCSCVPG
ncbi:hypothetical protein [Burkholderia sp. BCC1640]|uniref:hypothetical protein n=1 Tax=Burkholderia sp. BCC1640 TaxID=2676294 RepID=UPI0024460C92|nr:hypothetical protein [Burkholderia sp. BCC1640]